MESDDKQSVMESHETGFHRPMRLKNKNNLTSKNKNKKNTNKNPIKTKKMKVEISNILKERLSKINDKVSNFILDNLNAPETCLKSNRPQYLDFDGNLVTYIGSSKKKENPWNCSTRQGTKAVRVLRKVFTDNFINTNLDQRDIENFVSSWDASQNDTCRIVVYKGWDILKAFNYTDKINIKKFQASCANFKQHKDKRGNNWDEPMVKWFYFYIFNENISVPCVIEDGVIKARTVLFTGEQTKDDHEFKKGETYTLLNGVYSEGSEKYKHILYNWAKERDYFIREWLNGNLSLAGYKLNYKTFPPVDSMYGNFTKGVISTSYNGQSLYKFKQNGGNHKGKNLG